MFQDLPEGKTHYENDNCGEPAHNLMKPETYQIKVYCRNCKWEGTQKIDKGCSVECLSNIECTICGCKELSSLGISKKRIEK